MGRPDEAIAEAEQATQLDPVSPAAQANLASILWYAHRFERSIEQARRVLELNPDYSRAYEDLGRAYEQAGDVDAAIETFQIALKLEESHATKASLAFTYTMAGKRGEATKILKQLQDALKTSYVPAYSLALVCTGLGKVDEAFAWLDKAYEERSSSLPFLKVNPRLTSLHSDPRFGKLMRRVGLT